MPESIAAYLAICDTEVFPIPLSQQQRFLDALTTQHGVTITQQDEDAITFFVPHTTGQVKFHISESRIYTREEIAAVPNLFIGLPNNRRFIDGASDTPATNKAWFNFPFLIVFMIFAVVFANGQIFKLLGIAAIAFVIASLSVYEIWRTRRLSRNGQLLLGHIITCTGRWLPHSANQRVTRLYRVSYTYVVTMPNGKRRYGGNHQTYPYNAYPVSLGEPGQLLPLLYLPPNELKNL